MKALDFLNSSKSFVEIRQTSLQILDGEAGREMDLERLENGQLSPACQNRLAATLKEILQRSPWSSQSLLLCAIPARGVSLRRWSFPETGKDELQRLLLLRIETEFPLSPEKLAWGYSEIESRHVAPDESAVPQRQFLVAAVRKEVIEEYAGLFESAGVTPLFTLGALARGELLSGGEAAGSCALLEIGPRESELLLLENGVPTAVRLIAWGSDHWTAAGSPAASADRQKNSPNAQGADNPSGIGGLARLIDPASIGRKLHLSGNPAQIEKMASELTTVLEGCIACEPLSLPAGEGRSAATLGLKQLAARNGAFPLPLLQQNAVTRDPHAAAHRPAHHRWAVLALLLVAASLSLRYAESFIGRLRLSKKLSEIKAYQKTLPAIDRELSFLQHLQSNQPPFLDALHTIASSTPPGARFDSVSMNRAGEVTLLGSMRTAQEAVGFRSKMIDSGFFSTVVVEEQTPTPDRQKVNFRISAKWKPAEDRQVPATKASETKAPNQPDPGNTPKPPPSMTATPPRDGATNPPPLARTTK